VQYVDTSGGPECFSPSTAATIVGNVRSLLRSFGAGLEDDLEDDVAVLALGVPADR
jgi:hypothetical protein